MGYRSISSLFALSLFFLGGCSACSTASYLWQAGEGQLALFNRARPIPEVLKDDTTPPRIKSLLGEVTKVKAFGERMGLKPTKNYEEYVKLDRDAVVYVVSACDPLKFNPKEWSFPIVGGFPYLGWYDAEDAKKYGDELRKEGFDVDVRGAPAYSTLGWFRDPILSTMIPDGDGAAAELIEVILHESFHATAYVNHQAFFNESAASWVSEKLTPIYLKGTRPASSGEEKGYLQSLTLQSERQKKLHEAYVALEKVYSSSEADTIKLEKKGAILSALRKDLKWRDSRDLNNATLIGYREYGSNREVFDQIFKRCGGSWKRFLAAMTRLNEKDFKEKQTKDISDLVNRIECVEHK